MFSLVIKKINLYLIIILFILGIVLINFSSSNTNAFNNMQSNTAHIIIIAGQSNATGIGTLGSLDFQQTYLSDLSQTIKFNYKIWPQDENGNWLFNSNNSWEVLKPVTTPAYTNLSMSMFGPELSLAKSLQNNGVGDLYVVKVAKNGSSLFADWQPNGYLYNSFIQTINASIANLTNASRTVSLDGVYWVQGESDASNGQENNYQTNLTNFITAVRNDLNDSALQFYLNQALDLSPQTGVIRQAQIQVTNTVPNTYLLNSDYLPRPDSLHFDKSGQITLGQNLGAMSLPNLSLNFKRTGLRASSSVGSFKLRINNAGITKAKDGSQLEFKLPASLNFVGSSGTNWSCLNNIEIYSTDIGVRCSFSSPILSHQSSSELTIDLESSAPINQLIEIKVHSSQYTDQDELDNIIKYKLDNSQMEG